MDETTGQDATPDSKPDDRTAPGVSLAHFPAAATPLDTDLARLIRSDDLAEILRRPGPLWGGWSRIADRSTNREPDAAHDTQNEPE